MLGPNRRIPVLVEMEFPGDPDPGPVKPAMVSTVTVGELERLRDLEEKFKEMEAGQKRNVPGTAGNTRHIDWRGE
jgi:hypothetical protein